MKIKEFLEKIINIIYPNCCGICDKLCENDICKKCEIELNNISKININTYKDKYFKEHLYIFKYEGIIKERIVLYKFYEKSYIYKAFVKFIIKNKKICSFLKSYDIIVPVPIHFNRKIIRGYNQCELIAKEIARNILNINFEKNVLVKHKNIKPQSTKNKIDRIENVKNAFSAKNIELIKNKNIILLDDVYTTGSTVNECAKILMQAGANTVSVLTIAKD